MCICVCVLDIPPQCTLTSAVLSRITISATSPEPNHFKFRLPKTLGDKTVYYSGNALDLFSGDADFDNSQGPLP